MPSGSTSTHSTPPDARPRLRLKPSPPASGPADDSAHSLALRGTAGRSPLSA